MALNPSTYAVPGTIYCAHSYIRDAHLQELLQRYKSLASKSPSSRSSAGSSPSGSSSPNGIPSTLTFESSVFPDGVTNRTVQLSQSLLLTISSSLTHLNLAKSEITGKIFFRSQEQLVADAVKEKITVESHIQSDGRMIGVVRDDAPPKIIYLTVRDDGDRNDYVATTNESKRKFRYVRTRYDASNGYYFRDYCEYDWLRLKEVNVSSTKLSSSGLIALCTSTSMTLEILKMNDCPKIEDYALYEMSILLTALTHIEFSNCTQITQHGIMALSDMPLQLVRKLKVIQSNQKHISNDFFVAFLHALEQKEWTGVLICNNSKPYQGNYKNATLTHEGTSYPAFMSPVRHFLLQNPNSVCDLRCQDITTESLTTLAPADIDLFIQTKKKYLESLEPTDPRIRHYLSLYKPELIDSQVSISPISTLNFTPPIPSPAYSLNLSGRYINDFMLDCILQRFGKNVLVLKLDSTFITALGLLSLSLAPHLRVLTLASCFGITDKEAGNRNMMKALERNNMLELLELDISDTHLSGRTLSSHPCLALSKFAARSCPISNFALRLLYQNCSKCLKVLNLSNCSFLNYLSIDLILQFQELEVLDLSYCIGLNENDVLKLSSWPDSSVRYVRQVNINGITGVSLRTAEELKQCILMKKRNFISRSPSIRLSPNAEAVEVICSTALQSATRLSPSHESWDSQYVALAPMQTVNPALELLVQQKIQSHNNKLKLNFPPNFHPNPFHSSSNSLHPHSLSGMKSSMGSTAIDYTVLNRASDTSPPSSFFTGTGTSNPSPNGSPISLLPDHPLPSNNNNPSPFIAQHSPPFGVKYSRLNEHSNE